MNKSETAHSVLCSVILTRKEAIYLMQNDLVWALMRNKIVIFYLVSFPRTHLFLLNCSEI